LTVPRTDYARALTAYSSSHPFSSHRQEDANVGSPRAGNEAALLQLLGQEAIEGQEGMSAGDGKRPRRDATIGSGS
jgi:hypothetical protein